MCSYTRRHEIQPRVVDEPVDIEDLVMGGIVDITLVDLIMLALVNEDILDLVEELL